jgi:hypothetical protein
METLDLLKRAIKDNIAEVRTAIDLMSKPKGQLVEEIHENFFTEVDRILASAKISHSMESAKQSLIDKCKRLKELGFENAKEVKEAEPEIERLKKLEAENRNKKTLVQAIEYFSVRYPQYKFITEDSVVKICRKYGLVYGDISLYKGYVPEKNLRHIEHFKVEKNDECYLHLHYNANSGNIISRKYTNIDKHEKINRISFHKSEKCPLEIAAPIKDFDMKGTKVNKFNISKIIKVKIPDPVVLKPVFFAGKKHYLVVTAWGEEASDEMVVNDRMN